MINNKQNYWVSLIITRFEEQLPHRSGVQTLHAKTNADHIQTWLIKISNYRFSLIFSGLIKILTRVNECTNGRVPGSEVEKQYQESQLTILDTLEKCLLANQSKDMTRLDEAVNVQSLLREICQFIVLDTSNENQNNVRLKSVASKLVHTLSVNFFNVVFSKISGRLEKLSGSEDNLDCEEIELIQHISLDINGLNRLFNEIVTKFRVLKKTGHGSLINSLEIAVWKWIVSHPDEFGNIQKVPHEELARNCEALFDILDATSVDSKKGRPSVWSLQLLMLLLSPKTLEQIVNADSGAPCSPKHNRKKIFIDTLKRNTNAHSAGKHNVEISGVVLVKLCKASTYINMQHSNNVVFTLVQTVFNDLKTLMFNPSKPFLRGQINTHQDIEIMTECFVSFFRLKPHSTDALKVCLSQSSPSVYHYVLVTALYRIITEKSLPWWPKIDFIYARSCELRTMFTDTLNKVTHGFIAHTPLRMIQSLTTLKSKDGTGKLKDRGGEEFPSQKMLLYWMVRLIHADPMLMLNNQQGKPGHEIQSCTLELINGLVSLVLQTNMIDLAQEAMEALLVLHQPVKIEMWNPEAPISTFWDVSSQVLFSISQKMIQHQIVNYTDILKWLKKILTCRNEFLSRHKEYANDGTHIPICRQAHIKLEVVFLMYLWSIDTEAVYTSLSCFSLLCEEADIRCTSDEVAVTTLLPNYAVYQELSQTTMYNTGRSSLQRRIMAILRKLENCVNGVQPAWEETFRNWEGSTMTLMNFSKSKTDEFQFETCHRSLSKRRASQQSSEHDVEDQINEWAYMTGFLCAVGGVLQQNKTSTKPVTNELEFKKSFVLSTSSQDVQYCPVTQFISHLMKLLLCYGEKYAVAIQKHVKDLVGLEMSPSLYPILFDQIKAIVDKFFDQQGQALIEPGNTQFIEQVVCIMKTVLERKIDEPCENFGATSVEGMILTIVRYVRYLDMAANTIHLKTKICQLVDVIIKRRDDLSFRHEMKFRNKMVEYLSDWILGVSHQVSPSGSMDIPPIKCRDLDIACMEAVAGLLSGLPLQPEESDRGDLNEAKSQLFLKYFTLFMNLLREFADASQQLEKDCSWQEAEASKLNSLRTSIIQAISNLLSANIDSGLMHSIVATHHVPEPCTKEMRISEKLVDLSPYIPSDFYSKDTQNRAAFMEVLTKILQQGAEFNMLADSVLADRYEQLVQLVTMISDKGELPIAMALANVVTTSQMDELARVFVTIFEAKHLLSPLLWNMFYREVEVSDCMQTLFRGNSLGSKIMAFCFKIYGSSYLQNLLAPLIQPLIDGDVIRFEVDPARLVPGENIEENRENLKGITQTVFDAITSSGHLFPPQLRSMCHILYQVLSKRFPQSSPNNVSSVGTVIFLRFINPAIVSPQESGILNVTVPPHVKRGLMLMSKILQNIANHVEFSKEQHMITFNDFLRANFESARRFFVYIASDCEIDNEVTHSMSFVSDVNVHTLHRLLHTHQEKIGEYLSSSRDQKAVGRRPFDKLATLLAYLGPPEHKFPDMQWKSLDVPCFENSIGQPWLSAEEYKSMKSLNIFYQYGISKANHPVFYYIARRFKHEEVNNEKFMMFVIQTVSPYQRSPFELFIDFTHTGTESRFRTTYLKNWVCCRGINWKNLVFTYVYNCNTWVREYSKFHESILAPIKSNRNVIFLESSSRIGEYIPVDQQKLPGATLALEEDLKVFNGALKVSSKDIKVAIKVGPSTLQITHLEKTKVLSHSVLLNDVYYAAEIEEVCLVDDNQFTITIVNDSAPLSFIHNDCDVIVQSIIHIRNRWELSQPESNAIHPVKIRPKDVPGTLLNMALLNLGSSDPNLRSAAYNQLCALTNKFDLKIEGCLRETSGLCIPSNNTIFIKSVSETLATNEPRLTLEFLDECIQSFQISNIEMKHLCLEYMTPWLQNLVKFCKSSDETKKQKVIQILEKLITLTIQEEEMYPSIQAKIWGQIGKVSDLIDPVLECFLRRSAEERIGSAVVDILADTAVALASANVRLVARKIISKLCSVFEQTCISPTASLEQHVLWSDIMILSRYLLMLSFNNCLDVVEHLPYLFHAVTFLAHAGPLNVRAAVHGLVINVIHSLCTCSNPTFSAETQRVLQMSLDEFSLRKYYPLFGISQVKSATVAAFRYHLRPPNDAKPVGKAGERNAAVSEKENFTLSSLEVVTDALLEIMEACARDINDCNWLITWTELAKNFAFCYNPALQPRALIVYGCICRSIKDEDIRQLLRILEKALEKSSDVSLIEAPVICLTRIESLIRPESSVHGFLFWIGVSVLQLDNEQLFETGLALIEQNLHILDSHGVFDEKLLNVYMMTTREPIEEWYFRSMDGDVGLSFKENFHFALVGHLIKGYRHQSSTTRVRTVRVLTFLLAIIAKTNKRDKFEVTPENIAYLTALVPVSEEVRNRCRLKHVETNFENTDPESPQGAKTTATSPTHDSTGVHPIRQKSWEQLDSNSMKSYQYADPEQMSVMKSKPGNLVVDHLFYEKVWKSLDLDPSQPPPRPPLRSSSLSIQSAPLAEPKVRADRLSISNENNILLDPEVIADHEIQVLTLTVLSTLVKYSTDENEMRILYQYLAEGSVVFSKVFRVVYNLLDARLTSILQSCHDEVLLNSVQSIIHNMIACEDTSQDHLYYVRSCGFGGLWRFAGPFNKSNPTVSRSEMFANYLEAIVETILPSEEGDNTAQLSEKSTSVSLVTLGSPIEKDHSSS